MHRAVETCFKLPELIPNLHATAYCYADTARYSTFFSAVVALVRSDFASGGFLRGHPPLAAHRIHREQVVGLTLMRHQHTRARTALESPTAEVDEALVVQARSE